MAGLGLGPWVLFGFGFLNEYPTITHKVILLLALVPYLMGLSQKPPAKKWDLAFIPLWGGALGLSFYWERSLTVMALVWLWYSLYPSKESLKDKSKAPLLVLDALIFFCLFLCLWNPSYVDSPLMTQAYLWLVAFRLSGAQRECSFLRQWGMALLTMALVALYFYDYKVSPLFEEPLLFVGFGALSFWYWWLPFPALKEKAVIFPQSFMVLGVVGGWIWPDHARHFLHLFYVGSFGLWLLFALSKDQSFGKKTYGWLGGLIALAALTRGTAHMLEASYLRHLAYAALLALGVFIYLGWQLRPGRQKSKVRSL